MLKEITEQRQICLDVEHPPENVNNAKFFSNLYTIFIFSTRFDLPRGHLQEMFSVANHLVDTSSIALPMHTATNVTK
jgi:hypothetical protein